MEGWMDGITGVFEESDELFKEHVCFFFFAPMAICMSTTATKNYTSLCMCMMS